ncbi:site-specific DNA-methyltransferase [Priestia megaterium]|uniref:site-specific DNA-methyltransferase n=1 Tax=Priestia megaterium TaxID=1404 RepID=UPI0036285AC4
MKDLLKKDEGLNLHDLKLKFLKEKFPQCFLKDGSFDIKKFEEEISLVTNIVKEGYSLNWLGKSYAQIIANLQTKTMITPDLVHNKKEENKNSQNVYIKGDNLDVLKHLVNAYSSKVKMIYIDPPYNTGSDDFVYQDNFTFTPEQLANLADIEIDEANRILDFTDRKSSSHSAWLTFMYPRLFIARDLLKEDGVIFISIDENEQAQLKILCDEIFSANNFVGTLILQTATDNNPTQINTEHEYILCYAKNLNFQGYWQAKNEKAALIQDKYQELKNKFDNNPYEIQLKLREWIKNNSSQLDRVSHYDNVDEKGVFHDGDVANTKFGGYQYEVIHPKTGKICKVPEKGFRFPKETMDKMIKNGDIMFGEDETTLIKPKKRLENAKDLLRTIIYEDGRSSTKILENLFQKGIFQNPKSPKLLKRLMSFTTNNQDIILDFFGGSSTTAQAVLELNSSEENSNRKFILVQIKESTAENSIAKKAGYKYITDIGVERIKRAATKIKEETKAYIDYGFKIFETETIADITLDKMEEFKDELISTEHILYDVGLATIITTWMLQDGHQLTAQCEIIDLGGYEAFKIDNSLYLLNSSFSVEVNFKKIVEFLEQDEAFVINKIIVLGYSFDTQTLLSLKENVKHLINGRKSADVHLEVRY